MTIEELNNVRNSLLSDNLFSSIDRIDLVTYTWRRRFKFFKLEKWVYDGETWGNKKNYVMPQSGYKHLFGDIYLCK